MEVALTVKLQYDRAKDGTLSDFRTKKYLPFRNHIARLQLSGLLPRGEIKWSIETKQPEPPRPSLPAVVVPFNPLLPILLHQAGTRLEAA